MQKIKWMLFFCLLAAYNVNAQSLIKKFVENTFILSDVKKSGDGFYYDNVDYNLKEGLILIINAIGYGDDIKPMFMVKGTITNGKPTAPTLKFIDTSLSRETNAVYLINKTDDYTIMVANSRKGKKGIIKTKMGLGNMAWMGDASIFPTNNKTPFALALKDLLFHAIFNFNLIRGEKMSGSYTNKILFEMPMASMDYWQGTSITIFQDLNAKMKGTYYNGAIYLMNEFKYKSSATGTGGLEFDQKDSTLAVAKFESLKKMLITSLPNDFVLERETNFPIYITFEQGNYVTQNGRRIIFTNKGNDAIIDPSNKLYALLATNKMKVELCLHTKYNEAKIYLRIYSEEDEKN